jgi:hypothetical protein
MNLDQNLFKSDSRGNAVVPLTGSRNGRKEKILTEVIKSNPLKLLASKGKSTEVDAKYNYRYKNASFLPQGLKAKGNSKSQN